MNATIREPQDNVTPGAAPMTTGKKISAVAVATTLSLALALGSGGPAHADTSCVRDGILVCDYAGNDVLTDVHRDYNAGLARTQETCKDWGLTWKIGAGAAGAGAINNRPNWGKHGNPTKTLAKSGWLAIAFLVPEVYCTWMDRQDPAPVYDDAV